MIYCIKSVFPTHYFFRRKSGCRLHIGEADCFFSEARQEYQTLKEKITKSELFFVASMLFGLFFGAGNLIFPIYMGQLAGSRMIPAVIGFLITGVGLPLLGVTAMGISRSDGLIELSGKVGRGYSVFFTCALYLTIGPFFAIPRCATVPFTVGIEPILGEGVNTSLALVIFSVLFFAAVLAFSLFPGKILTWVGKIINPLFLIFLGILVVAALIKPIGAISDTAPVGAYADKAFATGFLEGYNTMDALASLAFGIVVINVIRGLGVKEPRAVAKNTIRAGVFSCLIMAAIYVAVTVVGAQSRGLSELCKNGGEVFAVVADHYFGKAGAIILAVTVTFACLKTAVGLVTSCSETFVELFPKLFSYRVWAIIFSLCSFLIANLGLNAIISYSLPVLMFLYPLAITLILLGLFGNLFGHSKYVYRFVTGFTLIAAIFDFLGALPKQVIAALRLEGVLKLVNTVLPFSEYGLGWIIPAALGLLVGLVARLIWEKPAVSGGQR